jgi:hypothetical protein
LKAVVWIALLAAVVWLVMMLWNWLMPALFDGAKVIGYWHALGLLALCKILFGGGGHGRWKHHRRWERLSAEERAAFKEHFKEHVRGHWGRRARRGDAEAQPTNPDL